MRDDGVIDANQARVGVLGTKERGGNQRGEGRARGGPLIDIGGKDMVQKKDT